MASSERLLFALSLLVCILFHVCTASPLYQINRPLWTINAIEDISPLSRRASSDPSCPDGWLCVQNDCPSGVVCPAGETCINFEGTIGCVPAGSSWCSINPTTYQGVGCYNGKCCHGNCYAEDSVCCEHSATTCSIGTSCLACAHGQTCSSSGTCTGSPGGSAPSSTRGSSDPTGLPNPGQIFLPPASGSSDVGCNKGTGHGDYATLCEGTCSFGYCVPPCQCTGTTQGNHVPDVVDPILAYPAAGRDCNFFNLCLIYCHYDPVNCPRAYCSEEEDPNNCLKVEISQGTTDPAPLWKVVDCFNPGVTDPNQQQSTRWSDVYTTDAWNEAVAFWNSHQGVGGLTFPEQISNFFNGPENSQCGIVVDNNDCSSSIQCGDVNHPAGYFIYNSMVQVNNMILNMNSALGKDGSHFALDMGPFQSTFATIEDESLVQKLILDFVSLGFSYALATQWTVLFKEFSFFKNNPNATSAIQAGVGASIQTGLTIIGQLAVKSPNPLNIQNTLDGAVDNFIINYQTAIEAAGQSLFNGSTSSVNSLFSLVEDGKLMEPRETLSDNDLQAIISKAIYGFLIPQAWSFSNKPIAPFILKAGTGCHDHVDASKLHMTADTADKTNICFEDDFYFLVAAQGPMHCTVTGCPQTTTCSSTFVSPDGASTLDGSQWSGLVKDDFIIGAVNSWNANGQKNGWPTADPSQAKTFDDIFNLGVRTHGYVHIPVCDAETAWYNWQEFNNDKPDYPCTPIPNDKKRDAVALQWSEELEEKLRREC